MCTDVLNFAVVMVAPICKYTNTQWPAHSVVYKLHLNKAIFKIYAHKNQPAHSQMGIRIRKRKGIWEKKYQINNTKLPLKSRISGWRGPFAFYNFILTVTWIWCFCNQKMILSFSEECYQRSQREKGNLQLSMCYFPALLSAAFKRRCIKARLLLVPPSVPRKPDFSLTARMHTVVYARGTLSHSTVSATVHRRPLLGPPITAPSNQRQSTDVEPHVQDELTANEKLKPRN